MYMYSLYIAKSLNKTNQMKATKQYTYFPVVLWRCLFIMLYKVVLTFVSVDKMLKWDHSNENCTNMWPLTQKCQQMSYRLKQNSIHQLFLSRSNGYVKHQPKGKTRGGHSQGSLCP